MAKKKSSKPKMNFKLDWKQMMLQRGEYIGLGVAGSLCTFMVLPLFWYMLFGKSTSAVVKELDEPTKKLQAKQQSQQPNASTDLPPGWEDRKAGGPVSKVQIVKQKIDKPEDYQVATSWFGSVPSIDSSKRLMPNILSPSEGIVSVLWAQASSYMFNKGKGDEVMVLKGGAADPAGQPAPTPAPPRGRRPGGAGFAGGAVPNNNQGFESQGPKRELEAKMVKVDDLGDMKDVRLAETVKPLRMAVVCANFPLRAQIEEFRKKLNLKSAKEVVETDKSGEVDDEKQPLNSFRFLDVALERRVVDSHGNPLADSTWQLVDMDKSYNPLLYPAIQMGNRHLEADSDAVELVRWPGLTITRLPLLRRGQYPAIEMKLATLSKAAADLANRKNPPAEKPKNPFSPSGKFSPFTVPGAGDPATKPPGAAAPGKVAPGGGAGAPDPNEELLGYPEYALIRVIDIDLQAGKFYQYRVQVRMANPNYGLVKSVASPNFADSKEPLVSDWFEIKQTVSLPAEYSVYNLDQKEIDGPRYAGQHFKATIDHAKMAVFQIHKWVESLGSSEADPPVGEWVVAERIPVYRGEYIAKKPQRVIVPYWKYTLEAFVIAADSGAKKDPKALPLGVEIDFRPERDDLILVDFEGGEMKHSRVAKPGDKPENVTDKAGFEALILSPQGKLLARESWADKADKAREQRVKDWRQRTIDVLFGKDSAPNTEEGGGGFFGPKKPAK